MIYDDQTSSAMNYYEELGVGPDATEQEIRKAHRRLVKLMHPDAQPDQKMKMLAETQMRRLNSIVSTLLDPDQRQTYDEQLHAAQTPTRQSGNIRLAWAGIPWWLASAVGAVVLSLVAIWLWADHLGNTYGNGRSSRSVYGPVNDKGAISGQPNPNSDHEFVIPSAVDSQSAPSTLNPPSIAKNITHAEPVPEPELKKPVVQPVTKAQTPEVKPAIKEAVKVTPPPPPATVAPKPKVAAVVVPPKTVPPAVQVKQAVQTNPVPSKTTQGAPAPNKVSQSLPKAVSPVQAQSVQPQPKPAPIQKPAPIVVARNVVPPKPVVSAAKTPAMTPPVQKPLLKKVLPPVVVASTPKSVVADPPPTPKKASVPPPTVVASAVPTPKSVSPPTSQPIASNQPSPSTSTTVQPPPPTPVPATKTPVLVATNNPPPVASIPTTSASGAGIGINPHDPLEGEWVYAPKEPEKRRSGFYPPEFIDLKLFGVGDPGNLKGQYTAKYVVTDRPVSPEVNFDLASVAKGSRKFVWQSNNGAKGTMTVDPIDDRTIRIDWHTTSAVRGPALTSGTATLVRRQ